MSFFGNLWGKKLDLGGVNSKYMSMRPEGWISPDDRAEAERQRGRGVEALGSFYSDARAGAIRRMGQRGLGTSAAGDAILSRLSGKQGEGVQRVDENVASGLNALKLNREQFERQRILQAWQNDVGATMRNYENENARGAAFWNMLGEGVKGLGSMYGGKSSAGSDVDAQGAAAIYDMAFPVGL